MVADSQDSTKAHSAHTAKPITVVTGTSVTYGNPVNNEIDIDLLPDDLTLKQLMQIARAQGGKLQVDLTGMVATSNDTNTDVSNPPKDTQ